MTALHAVPADPYRDIPMPTEEPWDPWDPAIKSTTRKAAEEGRGGWKPVDLTNVLAGNHEPPKPTVGARDDGIGLFYPGRMHTVSSESEAGKTWLALSATKCELEAGNSVLYMDFEDDEGGVVGRLRTIGCEPSLIRERFLYLRPDESIEALGARDDLTDLLTSWKPTLAILDGVTEAMALHGMEMKDNTDIAKFGVLLPGFIADRGPATVTLDHVVKDRENRGRYAIGGVHKLNALNGAAYLLDNRSAFGIGTTGRSSIKIAKDRPGQLRRHALPSTGLHWFGDLILNSHSEKLAELSILPPVERTDEFRPIGLMVKIMAAIEEHGSLSGKKIEALVRGRAATTRDAIVLLQIDGYLSETTPFVALKEYKPGSVSG